jgi:hypothetical protein
MRQTVLLTIFQCLKRRFRATPDKARVLADD